MRFRIPQGLSDRPLVEQNLLQYLNRELVPVVRAMLRAMTRSPQPFEWSGGAATLDLVAARDFAASNTLSENSTLTLSNGYDGAEGTIYVQQDAAGGHTVTVVAPGRTILREDPFVDDNPAPGAFEHTRYHYTFMTIAGDPYVVFERAYLT